MLLLTICVAALWLPFGGLPLPALAETEEATRLLTALWQVGATLIGFSLVVLVLVVDLTRDDSLTSRSALVQSGVPLVFVLGLSLIAIAGAASAGLGHGGPTGWAGSFPLILAGVVLGGLMIAGGRALRLVSASNRQSVRASALRRELRSSIDRAALSRTEVTLLKETGAQWMPFVLWKENERSIIRADRTGVAKDVSLRHLRRLTSATSEPIEVCVLPGTLVTTNAPLIVLPLGASEAALGHARRVVSVDDSSAPTETWKEALSGLLDEGFTALQASRLALYSSIGNTLIDALCAIGPEWRAYGVTFERHLAEDVESPLGRGWLDILERELYRHLREALGDSERTQAVIRVPSTLAFRAHEEDIIGLAEEGLSIIGGAPFRSDCDSALEDECLAHLHMFARYSVLARRRPPAMATGRTASDRKLARRMTSLCTEIERAQIDREDWSGLARSWEKWQETADQASRRLEHGGQDTLMASLLLIEHLAHRMLLIAWSIRSANQDHELPVPWLPNDDHSLLGDAIARGFDLAESKWIPWAYQADGGYVGAPVDTYVRQAAALVLTTAQPECDKNLAVLFEKHRDSISAGFTELETSTEANPENDIALLEKIQGTKEMYAAMLSKDSGS